MKMRTQLKSVVQSMLPAQVELALRKGLARLGVHKLERAAKRFLLKLAPVEYNSSSANVYHCSAHKAASQWIKTILSDRRVHKYSGLILYHPYKPAETVGRRKVIERVVSKSFPPKTIVSPLYIDFQTFGVIPKPEKYKGFFVVRDPRDILISWYFSARYSHGATSPKVLRNRAELNRLSLTDGLLYSIKELDESGEFEMVSSWCNAQKTNPRVRVFTFEELTAPDNFEVFVELFQHCDIRIPDDALRQLLKDYSFERLTGGRKRGTEKWSSHYRRGIPRDWERYFNGAVRRAFEQATGNLLARLGYE